MVFERSAPVLLGLLACACTTTRPAGFSQGPQNAHQASSSEPPAAKRGRAGSESPPRAFELTRFVPLLATEPFAPIRHLNEQGEKAQAASLLARLVGSKELAEADRLAAHYLLGVLFTEAGQLQSARDAFSEAAEAKWTLRDDALLAMAEIDLAARDPELAFRDLSRVTQLRATQPYMRLSAEVASAQQRHEQAAQKWAELVEASANASDRLGLAQALLAQAEAVAPGVERRQLASRAVAEARKATVGLAADDDRVAQWHRLRRRAEAAGAKVPLSSPTEEKLQHLRGLAEQRKWDELAQAALVVSVAGEPVRVGCELDYLKAKALAGLRRWGEAADRLRGATSRCAGQSDLHAWILFNAGKYSAADGRHTQAVAYYADLERLHATSSLCDDARLRAAKSYEKMGAPARFISLLAKMPEDYPQGDMTMEGVLLLALHEMQRSRWASAAQVLEKAAQVVQATDSARGHEYAGTERYFLARCQAELGQTEEALAQYEQIVRSVPLSYYMLHAYSRLLEADKPRAELALRAGLERATSAPFSFPHQPKYDTFEFRRAMELLRVGDSQKGLSELARLGLGAEADSSLLWGIALLYDRAGDVHQSHQIARGRLTDWLAHYPEGDWKAPWEIGFPRPYLKAVEKESVATGVDPWLIYGVMREESTFRADVVSHADAYGLMQIILPTARSIGKRSGLPSSASALKKPGVNIAIGSRVLSELARRFKKNPWLAIPGYNAGPGRPASWLRERPNMDFDIWVESIPFRETRRYTKRVLASRAAYAFLYYREQAQTALVLPRRLNAP